MSQAKRELTAEGIDACIAHTNHSEKPFTFIDDRSHQLWIVVPNLVEVAYLFDRGATSYNA